MKIEQVNDFYFLVDDAGNPVTDKLGKPLQGFTKLSDACGMFNALKRSPVNTPVIEQKPPVEKPKAKKGTDLPQESKKLSTKKKSIKVKKRLKG